MRLAVTAFALAALPALAMAQSRVYQDAAALQWGQKRVGFYDDKRVLDEATIKAQQAAQNYTADNAAVRDEREVWLARYRIYENVISLRGKDEVMKYVDEQRARLGVSEQQGYQRLGIHNPFDGRSYIRYYDNDGNPKISEVRGFYDDLERQRQDLERKRARLGDERKQVDDLYDQAKKAYDKALASKTDLDQAYQDWLAAREKDRQADEEARRAAAAARQPDDPPAGGGGGGGAGADEGVVGLWSFNDRGRPYTMNFRGDGSVAIRLPSGNTVNRQWQKRGDGYFVNWGSARVTYNLQDGRLVGNDGSIGTR